MFFLLECNADISAHLLSCHLSICGDVTDAKLIMAAVGIRGMSATQLTHITICPRQTLAWKILASAKFMPIPWAFWESYKFGGKTRH